MHCVRVCVCQSVCPSRDCCWVTMMTGSAAMTGLCYHDRGHEECSPFIVLNVESHNWMLSTTCCYSFCFGFIKEHDKCVGKKALYCNLNSLYWQAHYFQSTTVNVLMDSQTHFSCLGAETLTQLWQSFILTVYWPCQKTSSVALKEAGSILACHLTTLLELMYVCIAITRSYLEGCAITCIHILLLFFSLQKSHLINYVWYQMFLKPFIPNMIHREPFVYNLWHLNNLLKCMDVVLLTRFSGEKNKVPTTRCQKIKPINYF